MKTRFAWFCVLLVLACGILLIQNLRLARQIAGLRIEMEQKNSPVVASEESKTSKMESDELDRLRKNNSELIRLRNKFGLLQNELTELGQQKMDLLREKQQAEAQNQLLSVAPTFDERIRNQIRATEIELIRHQRALEETRAELTGLARTLKIPDVETKLGSFADLSPAETQQLRPYYDLKRDFENHRRLVQLFTAKLAHEMGALESAK